MASRSFQVVFDVSFENVEKIKFHGVATAQNVYKDGSESIRYPVRKGLEAAIQWCEAHGVEVDPVAGTVKRWLNKRNASKVIEGTVYRAVLKTKTKDFPTYAEADAYASRYGGSVQPIKGE
jgi:hypothetical protein